MVIKLKRQQQTADSFRTIFKNIDLGIINLTGWWKGYSKEQIKKEAPILILVPEKNGFWIQFLDDYAKNNINKIQISIG